MKQNLKLFGLAFIAFMMTFVMSACDREEDKKDNKKIDEENYTPCFMCNGTGLCSYCDGGGTCLKCNGTGQYYYNNRYYDTCPDCKGTKTCRICVGSGVCTECAGSGESWYNGRRF